MGIVRPGQSAGFFFFKSYVGAALAAAECGLITPEDLASVAAEALPDYYAALRTNKRSTLSGRMDDEMYHASKSTLFASDEIWKALKTDIERANEFLEGAHLPPVHIAMDELTS